MNRDTPIDRQALAETLHYGVPINRPVPIQGLPFEVDTLKAARQRRRQPEPSQDKLLAQGADLWNHICRKAANRATRPLLLPLSAGLDSRAVLGGLRACGAPVKTVTYGVPGAFDYEIAPRIAAHAGVANERIDLTQIQISRAALLDVAKGEPSPSLVIDMFFNAQIAWRYGQEFTYINGFCGDALSGKHLDKGASSNWEQARESFVAWHQASRTIKLTDEDMVPIDALPSAPFVDMDLMGPLEQLDHAIRQQRLVRPVVCPAGYEVLSPFLDPEWCAFILGLPDALRRDQRFFIALFQYSYPELFALPTTASGGLPLGASDAEIRRYRKKLRRQRRLRSRLSHILPNIHVPPADRRWQYLDFRNELRRDSTVAALFDESMARLDDSGAIPWIDAQGILRRHREEKTDHFKALNVLFNLELLLEARPDLFEPSSSQ